MLSLIKDGIVLNASMDKWWIWWLLGNRWRKYWKHFRVPGRNHCKLPSNHHFHHSSTSAFNTSPSFIHHVDWRSHCWAFKYLLDTLGELRRTKSSDLLYLTRSSFSSVVRATHQRYSGRRFNYHLELWNAFSSSFTHCQPTINYMQYLNCVRYEMVQHKLNQEMTNITW